MPRKLYTPRPWAVPIVPHILDVPRCAVWATMGSGKTAPTLTALDLLFLAGEDHPALVIGPPRVAEHVWKDEAAKWSHLRQIDVVPIVGDESERLRAMRFDASVNTISWNSLPWLVEHWGDNWPYRIVVKDEARRLKGYRGSEQVSKKGKEFTRQGGSMRARALARVAHTKIKRFIELTGTPAANGLKDLWGQAWFLDAGQRLGRTHDAFMRRWFARSYGEYGVEPLPYASEQIQDALRDLCLTVDIADYIDIKEPVINDIFVTLPPKARQHYKDMEKEMFTEIEANEIEAFGAAARTQKCLQLANGAAYVGSADDPGERKWVAVHDEKLDALESCVEEANGMPQIVVYEFKSDLARIHKKFPDSVVLSERSGMARFKAGGSPMGLAHAGSVGHGVDGLQNVTNIMTFFGHNWDLELTSQIKGRVDYIRQWQSGSDRPLHINRIIARDTVDEMVIDRQNTKRTVQEVLLEAMKRKG